MLAKLYHGLAILAIATTLAVGGFVGRLFGSGRLTAGRIETMAAVLRGEHDEVAADTTTTQPAEQDEVAQPSGRRSAEQVRQALVSEQLRRAALERAARDVEARQELLDHAMQHLLSRQEKFEQDQAAWVERKRKETDALRDAGFQQELRLVGKLSPKLAKEHVVRSWQKHQADAVRLLRALNESKGQRILEQFKTPEEIEIMHQLLEQLRLQETDELAAGSGRASGDASD
jgi:hypothetical protein